VLWNADGQPLCVEVPRSGTGDAQVIDKRGAVRPADSAAGGWTLLLGPATAQFGEDPPGYFFIGGDPLLLVEQAVSSDAPVRPPRVGCD